MCVAKVLYHLSANGVAKYCTQFLLIPPVVELSLLNVVLTTFGVHPTSYPMGIMGKAAEA
jgi:hypothetical protein